MVSLSVRIDPQLEIDSSLSDILDTSFNQVDALMPICLFVFFPPMRSYQKKERLFPKRKSDLRISLIDFKGIK